MSYAPFSFSAIILREEDLQHFLGEGCGKNLKSILEATVKTTVG